MHMYVTYNFARYEIATKKSCFLEKPVHSKWWTFKPWGGALGVYSSMRRV